MSFQAFEEESRLIFEHKIVSGPCGGTGECSCSEAFSRTPDRVRHMCRSYGRISEEHNYSCAAVGEPLQSIKILVIVHLQCSVVAAQRYDCEIPDTTMHRRSTIVTGQRIIDIITAEPELGPHEMHNLLMV